MRPTIPREVNKWLISLDLTYKVKNPKRDLANGYIIGEILSKYFPLYFELKALSTGTSERESTTNWQYLIEQLHINKKRQNEKEFRIETDHGEKKSKDPLPDLNPLKNLLSEELILRIKKEEPNTAFIFLCEFYKLITKKEPIIINKTDESNIFKNYENFLPKFMRPTANLVIKDSIVHVIKDELIKKSMIKDIIYEHNQYLKKERQEFIENKIKFKAKKRKIAEEKDHKISKSIEKIEKNNEDQMVNNENDKKQEVKKEEKLNFNSFLKDKAKHLSEDNTEKYFNEIVFRNYIDIDHNIELEFKKNSNINEIQFFLNSINTCNEDQIIRIFQGFNERSNDFIDIISRTLIELVPFLDITIKLLDKLIKYHFSVGHYINSTLAICQEILKRDPLKCETIFLQYGLDIILKLLSHKPNYRLPLCNIIFSLISNNRYSHLQVLNLIKRRFLFMDELLFYHILVKCIDHTNKDNLETCSLFYLRMCHIGLNNQCDFIKIKCMYLINVMVDMLPLSTITYAEMIFKHRKTNNWEILSQILIYSSKLLNLYNELKKVDDKRSINEMDSSKDDENRNEYIEMLKKYEDKFLEIIDEIFVSSSHNMTVKIGFIYLTEILQYYPLLAKKYIKLLIEFRYWKVMKESLVIDNDDSEMEYYTNNCYTELYKISGAPKTWNPLIVAGIYRDYVRENLDRLELIHLEILFSIIINQNFVDEESDQWVLIYKDINEYLFISLCQKELSGITLAICKKFFSFINILNEILDCTFNTFISSMKIIYRNSIFDESHMNMKELLNYLSEIDEGNYKVYIYKLLKNFAINYNELYISSNLLDLMNRIHKEERGEIFINNLN